MRSKPLVIEKQQHFLVCPSELSGQLCVWRHLDLEGGHTAKEADRPIIAYIPETGDRCQVYNVLDMFDPVWALKAMFSMPKIYSSQKVARKLIQ